MKIQQLDHLVLTVKDIQTSINFYSDILGMQAISFGDGRKALSFGTQKINLHHAGNEFIPHAENPAPGSADLCFISDTAIEDMLNELKGQQVHIVDGPVERTGAMGKLLSIYITDPDGNLIELSNLI